MIAKAAVNKAFLKKDFTFNFDSNSKNLNNSNPNKQKSNNLTSFQSFKSFIWLLKKQIRSFNSLIATFNINYAKEKFIRILNKDVLVTKKR